MTLTESIAAWHYLPRGVQPQDCDPLNYMLGKRPGYRMGKRRSMLANIRNSHAKPPGKRPQRGGVRILEV